jgi:high-affinity K+ transport system ATPase subunit B
MNYNEEKIIGKIKEGLSSIDQLVPVNTPDISRFREMVTFVENRKRQKAKKEVIIFVVLAFIIITFEVYACNQSIIFFVALQSFAFTAVIAVLLNWLKNRRKKVKTI